MSWLYALWFFLPAGVANAVPVIVNKVPLLNKWKTPLDFGLKHKGKQLLGPNKTIRGVVCGTIVAAMVGLLQQTLALDGFMQTSAVIGGALGFGALLGDAVESFFKRKRGVPSGEKWFPFDQTDYILGGLLLVSPFTDLTWMITLQVFIVWFGMHLLFAYIGYKLGLKDSPI